MMFCATSQTLTVPIDKLRLLIAENEKGKTNTQLLALAQEQIGVYRQLVGNRDSVISKHEAQIVTYQDMVSAANARTTNAQQETKQMGIYYSDAKRQIKRQRRSKTLIIIAAIASNIATAYFLTR